MAISDVTAITNFNGSRPDQSQKPLNANHHDTRLSNENQFTIDEKRLKERNSMCNPLRSELIPNNIADSQNCEASRDSRC
jgi:hypothetical protein